jgi:riboflavin biosynthesis pyrimidine reductase
VRQIHPTESSGQEVSLPGLYAYPDEPARGGRPWVRANMVASADGAATANGRSGGLSGEADRTVFGVLRALADVVLVGAGTVRAEAYRTPRVGERWAWLREGRPAAPPIAVLSRSLDLGQGRALVTGTRGPARTIVITVQAAPADRKAAVARDAELIIAGEDSIDLHSAISALAAMGHRRILTEGGPHLLEEIIEAGLLDELCLTISPLLAGSGAGRIVQGMAADAERPGLGPLSLAHVLEDQGYLLCRYVRSAGPAGAAISSRGPRRGRS